MTVTRTVCKRTGPVPYKLESFSESIDLERSTDVLIRVHAVSLNYRDVNILRGGNPWGVKDNGVPCSDAVGEVISLGSTVSKFRIGDRVSPTFDLGNIRGDKQERTWLGSDVDGVLATHLIFAEAELCRIPSHLSWFEASTICCAGLTAWNALNLPSFLTGKTVLLQGTGGVSLFALTLAHAAGAQIIITSSSDAKLARIRDQYPEAQTINYKSTPDWEQRVLELTGDGADIVIDNGGLSTLLQSVKATHRRGLVSSVGYLAGNESDTASQLVPFLIDRSVTLKGVNVGSLIDFERLVSVIGNNRVRLEALIDKVFEFSNAPAAFDYLATGNHIGKVVVQVP